MDKLKERLPCHQLEVILGCDCRSALESTFYSFRAPRVNDHHADIKSAIHHYTVTATIHLQPTHIFAHQDDFLPYHQITQIGKNERTHGFFS